MTAADLPHTDAASDNPASRKLPAAIELALEVLINWSADALSPDPIHDPSVADALEAVRAAVRPSLAFGDAGVLALQQLRAARQWLRFLVDELDLEPDDTAYVVNVISPDGQREAARITLAHSLAQMDTFLEGAAA